MALFSPKLNLSYINVTSMWDFRVVFIKKEIGELTFFAHIIVTLNLQQTDIKKKNSNFECQINVGYPTLI